MIALVAGAVVVVGVVRKNRADARRKMEAVEALGRALEEARHGAEGLALEAFALDPAAHDYRRVRGETLLAVQPGAERLEPRRTGRFSTGQAIVSIPIVKGLRLRFSTGALSAPKSLVTTARGRLLLTDRAIVFEGDAVNERLTWGRVADVEIHLDGYVIERRTGPPRIYLVASPDPRFVVLLERVLEETA